MEGTISMTLETLLENELFEKECLALFPLLEQTIESDLKTATIDFSKFYEDLETYLDDYEDTGLVFPFETTISLRYGDSFAFDPEKHTLPHELLITIQGTDYDPHSNQGTYTVIISDK